ncbi:MAG: methyltransferase domain-containing protein [Pseudomonadota bacterium]
MSRRVWFFAALASALLALSLALDARRGSAVASVTDGPYSAMPETPDGIGKIYLGREISKVMGHRGAAWLERPGRVREERTDVLLDALPLADGMVVADIGAGTGFFSFPIAERIGSGRVLAVDIQAEMLDIIRRRQAAGAPANVVPVLGTETDPSLETGSVDLILIVDAYHEFSYPLEMGEALVDALKPGGRMVLVEYRAEDRSVPIKWLHKMSEAQARKEMAAIGLDWTDTLDVLPQQHILVFAKPAQRAAINAGENSAKNSD